MATASTGSLDVESQQRARGVTIAFDTIAVARNNKTVIEDATGILRAGRLTAVVSSCGARGDYHLLSALAGHTECTAGNLCANGTPVVSGDYKNSAVFVDEDMAALEQLTVRQNLEYSAAMRVRDSSRQLATVDEVMTVMKLDSIAHREVRKLGLYARRRVAIAKELVLRPLAVFIDLPVDGLATHECKEFLRLLKNVAQQTNAIVAVSMVQPRWVTLSVCDDIILLERTRVAFAGSTDDLLTAMTDPNSANYAAMVRPPAESPLRNEDGTAATADDAAAAAAVASTVFPETALNEVYRTATSPNSTLSVSYPLFVEAQNRVTAEVNTFLQRCARGEERLLSARSRGYHNPLIKLLILSKYGFLQIKNNIFWYIGLGVLALLVAILLATVYTKQDANGQSGMQNRTGILFFLISSTLLHNMLLVDGTKREYLSFQRHREHSYYSSITFLFYWMWTNALTRFLGCVAFVAVVFSLAKIGSSFDLTSLNDLIVIVALTSFSTSALVWMVCCLAPTARLAHFAMFGLYTFNVILAGLLINLQTLPSPFQVLSNLSVIRLGYESAILSQFVGKDFGCDRERSPQQSTCFTGDGYLTFLGFHVERKWQNLEYMTYITLGVIAVSFVAMLVLKSPNSSRSKL